MFNPLQPVLSSDAETRLPWLAEVRTRAKQNLQKTQFPTRKTEAWKYTSLKALQQNAFFSAVNSADITGVDLPTQSQIPGFDCYTLVFVNGVFKRELSDCNGLPAGAELVVFSEANAEQQTAIAEKLDTICKSEQHLFAAVNSAQICEGVYLAVQENQVLDKPVKLLYLNGGSSVSRAAQVRVLVDLSANAEVTLLEHYLSQESFQDNEAVLTNALTEIQLAEGARLNHYRLNLEEQTALHLGGVHVALGRNANLESFYLALGSELKRFDIVVHHRGEGAHCELRGVYLPRQKQLVDFHTCIEHAVPHCTSNEIFRGIVADSAKAVFNGRIHIHPDAQKTLAQLSNKNLLTSDKAEVDTKPELEIYADDVQCAHGATVAQLDSTALHYMQTRGVSAEEAKVMLSFGFINELINDIKHPVIAEYLRPLLAKMFARDERLMRHIA